MSDSVTIRTPESIEVSYELAGFGSRLLAGLLDYFIVASLMILCGLAISLFMGLLGWLSPLLVEWIGSLAVAAYIISSFLVFWGYFIFFEMVWNGQTPGKRVLGLRTIREGGFDLGFFPSVARNLVRMADMFPAFYLVGFISMVLDKRRKRLGDFVAGTIVISEQGLKTPEAWNMGQSRYNTYLKDPALAQRIRTQITHPEFETLKDLYLRRDQIPVDLRMKLDQDLFEFISTKLELVPDPTISNEQAIRNVLEIRQQEE